MKPRLNVLTLAPMLALSLLIGACSDQTDSPIAPEATTIDRVVVKYRENGTTVIKETDPTVGVVSGIFDEDGGKLIIGNHTLIIPRKAVQQKTVFTMGKTGPELHFGLTATSVKPLKDGGEDADDDDDERGGKKRVPPVNNVGSAGFKVPVQLQVSYRGTRVENPSKLKVYRVLDGKMIEQPTTVDLGAETVTGTLKRFSDYAIGFPN